MPSAAALAVHTPHGPPPPFAPRSSPEPMSEASGGPAAPATVAFCVHGARTWLQRTAPLLRRHVLAPLRALALQCRPRGEPPEDGDALPWTGHAAPHEGAQALACLAPCLRLVQEHESRHGLRCARPPPGPAAPPSPAQPSVCSRAVRRDPEAFPPEGRGLGAAVGGGGGAEGGWRETDGDWD